MRPRHARGRNHHSCTGVGVRTANTDEALRGVGCAFTVRDFTEAPLRDLLGVSMDEAAPSR